MSGFELSGWALLGALLIMLSGGLIVGAALGYYTAASDLRREKSRAWEQGAGAMRKAIARVWEPPSTLTSAVRNPYREGVLAPEPPHIVIPNPGQGERAEARRSRLYDQDEPTTRAIAVELRGDS